MRNTVSKLLKLQTIIKKSKWSLNGAYYLIRIFYVQSYKASIALFILQNDLGCQVSKTPSSPSKMF